MANADAPLPTQISWEHIKQEGWAIPLRTRKTNIKKGAEMRQLEKVRDAPVSRLPTPLTLVSVLIWIWILVVIVPALILPSLGLSIESHTERFRR